MTGKCKIPECPAPDAACHLGKDDFAQCENFIQEIDEKKNKKAKTIETNRSIIGWNGEAFTTYELGIVSSRTSPFLIGIVGKAAAGKDFIPWNALYSSAKW